MHHHMLSRKISIPNNHFWTPFLWSFNTTSPLQQLKPPMISFPIFMLLAVFGTGKQRTFKDNHFDHANTCKQMAQKNKKGHLMKEISSIL